MDAIRAGAAREESRSCGCNQSGGRDVGRSCNIARFNYLAALARPILHELAIDACLCTNVVRALPVHCDRFWTDAGARECVGKGIVAEALGAGRITATVGQYQAQYRLNFHL
jgi:hypothetical protein